jgi:hypothetical protein
MQRAATQVDRQDAAPLAHHQVDAHVRRLDIDIGARTGLRAQGVDHRILDPLRGVTSVGDRIAGYMRIDCDGVTWPDMPRPVDLHRAGEKGVLVGAFEFVDRPQHSACQP